VIAFDQATLVLLLRVGLIALLYLFLAMVVLAVRRDLAGNVRAPRASRRGATASPGGAVSSGWLLPTDVASLVVVNPGPTSLAPGYRFALRNPTLIGRGATNDINLDDEFVSNHHARLMLLDVTWHLEDLGTTNGTWRNGARLRGTTPLAPGDVFTVGRLDLRLEAGP
jgi:hypothetical protein